VPHIHFFTPRTLGGSLGIAIGQAIWSSFLQRQLKSIPGITFATSPGALSESVRHLKEIPDVTTRNAVMHAYANAISKIWLVNTPICGAGLIMSTCVLDTTYFGFLTIKFPVLFVRAYSLKRTIVQGGDAEGDIEKGKTEDLAAVNASAKEEDEEDEKKTIREILRADPHDEGVKDDVATEATHAGDALEVEKSGDISTS